MADPIRVIIAGGGTGGHLFPGIAIADQFSKIHPENRILFVGTGRPFEKNVLQKAGYPHRPITASGLKRVGLRKGLAALLKIPLGLFESLRLIREYRPHIVIGVGGYSAGPVVVGAFLTGIPAVLHEQNSIPGITNQCLVPFVRRICTSFPGTRFRGGGHKIRVTGNPVREGFLRRQVRARAAKPFTVLIIGGSQGARAVNETVIQALPYFAEAEGTGASKNRPREKGSAKRFHFIHQTGAADLPAVQRAYAASGISGRVSAFFHDMASCYADADLIVSRAGATTIAEITGAGKAAILIPFPFAADNHQVYNAQWLADGDGAEMILQNRLTPEMLAAKIIDYKNDPGRLRRMAARSQSLGRPDAAARISADCYRIIRQQR